MTLISLQMRSQALQKCVGVKILLNDAAAPPYPVYYLLHGLSDNETVWTRQTSLERYAAAYPFLIVMPDGGRSFYTDSPLGAYETFIAQELVTWIDRQFRTRQERRYRAIGGLSMGGYGALRLAWRFPRRFGAIAAHSAAADFGHVRDSQHYERIPEARLILDACPPEALDLWQLAAACPRRLRPRLYFDCGRRDWLLPGNQRLHRHLLDLGYRHCYRVYPGQHDWAYWDKHIQDAFAFVSQTMGQMRRR
ncbi:MAG: esterase family protein [Planctomycetota bacterium]|nr:esterase family protein [Planctomycetota bacterium]